MRFERLGRSCEDGRLCTERAMLAGPEVQFVQGEGVCLCDEMPEGRTSDNGRRACRLSSELHSYVAKLRCLKRPASLVGIDVPGRGMIRLNYVAEPFDDELFARRVGVGQRWVVTGREVAK